MSTDAPARAPAWAVLSAWALLAALEAYVALGEPGPKPTGWISGEVAICLAFGLITWAGLPSFPGLVVLAPAASVAIVAGIGQGSAPGALVAAGVVLALVFLATRRVPAALAPVLASLAMLLRLSADLYAGSGSASASLERLAQAFAWPAQRPTFGSGANGPPVVVITLDALRADEAAGMASWRRLAARGAAWDRATSAASWTMPALASIQTGLPPSGHGATCLPGSDCQGIQPGVQPLAERLRAAGYATAAVVANPWASRANGFARGFDAFVDLGNSTPLQLLFLGPLRGGPHRQSAEVAVAEALGLVERLEDRPFYLWVHLLEPHMPYLHAADPKHRGMTAELLRDLQLPSTEQIDGIRASYRGEIAYADEQVGRLLDGLEAAGVLDRGVVVLTSDHGEEFWDHGQIEHGHSHHAEVVDVPLVLVAPGVPANVRHDTVSTMDLASTVEAIVGLPTDGTDLREVQPEDRVVGTVGNLHGWMQCSARDGHVRAIVDDCGATNRVRRYDLDADPGERQTLPPDPDDPVQQRALGAELPRAGAVVDQNTEALRALGYVQ